MLYGNLLARVLFAGVFASFMMTVAAVPVSAEAADGPPRIDTSKPNPQPLYPESARQHGKSGAVTVAVRVEKSGTPSNVRVAKTSGWKDLDDAALDAVRRWAFSPAVRDGAITDEWTAVELTFNLDGTSQAAATEDESVQDQNRIVCKKNVGGTGSRLPGPTVCRKKYQWDDIQHNTQQDLNRARNSLGATIGN